MIITSSRTYQKFSSNGLDLVDLEPKQGNHRQNRIYPAAPLEKRLYFYEAMFRPTDKFFSERRAALRWSLKHTAGAPLTARCLRVPRSFTKEEEEMAIR